MALPNTSKTGIEVVFGCMTFGEEGKEQSRIHDINTCQEVLDVFKKHGHNELDTARFYGGGTSEQYLGKMGVQSKQGMKLATKVFPVPGYEHTSEGIRKALTDSLTALQVKKVDIYYLHAPDRKTPYIDTCRTMNELHKEGLFDEFGISNYMAWEVAELVYICKMNNWVQPTIYQGLYNAIGRAVEPELFPCLRKFGIKFYAFNPLAGGFFTGRYSHKETEVEAGGRFDPNKRQGQMYRARYWNDTFFSTIEQLKPIAQAHNVTLVEIALRWMVHHSLLKKEHGDKIIIGASSVSQLSQNLDAFEKGPLPAEIMQAVDEAYEKVKAVQPKYFH
eukprot:Phypoly_transcript_12716.p1 GENE.Phypoly_transcript_12716~~Phypoly_transcript_12716.p1  ORF type:complete len:333 (+),score=58.42 Phypoly_transcript_12716:105-1103(+)